MVDSILCCIVIQGDRRIVHVAFVLAQPRESQPHQALFPRPRGVARILTELAAQGDAASTLMIAATHHKTH